MRNKIDSLFLLTICFLLSATTALTQTLKVRDIQYTASGNDSPYKGQTVRVEGIVSYIDAMGYIIADEGGGPWSGVYVYENRHRPSLGDKLRIKGKVEEYYDFTEITYPTEYSVLSNGHSIPPTVINANQISAEEYEGVLVKVQNITITKEFLGGKVDGWEARDGSGSCFIGDRVRYRFAPHINTTLPSVTGVVWYTWEDFYIMPRSDEDIEGRDIRHYALRGTVVTPEGPKKGWYVEILDDKIVSVSQNAQAADIYETGGIIFPGLIDSHNHPSYNSFPTLQFNNFPFQKRYDWQGTQEYSSWKDKRSEVKSATNTNETGRISKYGEILELMAGCIAIQGNYSSDIYAHPSVLLYNVEQFPSRAHAEIFPMRMDNDEVESLRERLACGGVNSVLIHLSEGINQSALDEFYTWKDDFGLLTEATAIIHGVPYTATEFQSMANVGAKLIWAPMSNMKLYEQTADVKTAKEVGVTIALAPDWTPSGRYNLLEELGYAAYLNKTMFNNAFTNKELCEMVTINAAIACGIEDTYGKIENGYQASVAVIEGNPDDPYGSLISARPKNVKLTIIDGVPRYGDRSLMEQFGINGEIISVSGSEKMFNIAVENALVPFSGETVGEIMSSLRSAHNSLMTNSLLNPDELQFLDFDLLESDPDNIAPFSTVNPLTAPQNGAQLEVNVNANLGFRWQDFWDNFSASTDLTHTIEIVPADNTNDVKQVIVENLPNTPDSQNYDFIPYFESDAGKEYVLRFRTRDQNGNEKITVADENKFRVKPGEIDDVLEPYFAVLKILSVSPNPASGRSSVTFRALAGFPAKISILDIFGNVAVAFEKTSSEQISNVSFDTSSMPAGVYFLMIEQGNIRANGRFIVAR